MDCIFLTLLYGECFRLFFSAAKSEFSDNVNNNNSNNMIIIYIFSCVGGTIVLERKRITLL